MGVLPQFPIAESLQKLPHTLAETVQKLAETSQKAFFVAETLQKPCRNRMCFAETLQKPPAETPLQKPPLQKPPKNGGFCGKGGYFLHPPTSGRRGPRPYQLFFGNPKNISTCVYDPKTFQQKIIQFAERGGFLHLAQVDAYHSSWLLREGICGFNHGNRRHASTSATMRSH